VKIINFSIGDKMRMFVRSMSPLARLFDWLSFKYEVLFIISAGNNYQVFPTNCSYYEFTRKPQDEISKLVTNELLKSRMQNRLLSPAESVNNITVGAVNMDDTVIPTYPVQVNPYDCLHPAIYTPFGGGLKNSIKPDLVYYGGRELLKEEIVDHDNIYPSLYHAAPGLWVAWPDNTACGMKFDRGTSGSAALVSRAAYRCYQEMHEILGLNGEPDSHVHLLIKAMLAHGCSWDVIGENIDKFLPATNDGKAIKRQWIGYGFPDFDKSLACNANRVTVLGFSELKGEEAHVYSMPLPPSMSNKKVKRRLTVTLAWMTPVACENQKYRRLKLWAEPENVKRIVGDRIDVADNYAVKRGTLQHEVFEGERRFTLEEDAVLNIKVNCAYDAGGFKEPVKYAIAVTLEFAPATNIDLFAENVAVDYYQEVRDRLRIPIPIVNH
jgi:hypothetical protein